MILVKTTCHFSANSSNAFVWPLEALHTQGTHKSTQADIHIHTPKEKIKNLRKAGRPHSTHRTMRRRQLGLCKQHHLRSEELLTHCARTCKAEKRQLFRNRISCICFKDKSSKFNFYLSIFKIIKRKLKINYTKIEIAKIKLRS